MSTPDLPNLPNKTPMSKPGYEYLLAYKITVPVHDLNLEFCHHYISKFSRTHDQMTQAGRSGMQNISEGNKQQSLKSYIKLAGVARGSLEELLKDYHAYARQHQIPIWPKEKATKIKELNEIWKILKATPYLSNHPNFPNLPDNEEKVVNLMITLINQANYFLDKLIISLKEKHMKQGGFTENLYRRRREYRGY